MSYFITVDIFEDSGCSCHFTLACQCVEEAKARVEVNTFQDIVCNDCVNKVCFARIIAKSLVCIGDETVAFKQCFICTPFIINFVTCNRVCYSVQNVGITLSVNFLLECLDVQ